MYRSEGVGVEVSYCPFPIPFSFVLDFVKETTLFSSFTHLMKTLKRVYCFVVISQYSAGMGNKNAIVSTTSLSCRFQQNVMLHLYANAEGARARTPSVRDFGKPTSARNFGLVMTSLPSDRPPDRTYVRFFI